MNKEEAKAKLRKAESDLRSANVILEMHEQGVQEIKEEIAKLEAIINKPDRWQDSLVQPDKEAYFYISNDTFTGFSISYFNNNVDMTRNPEHAFRTEDQAELIKEKMLLMQEMYAFAHVKNEGWMPDWKDVGQVKHGIVQNGNDAELDWFTHADSFVFGVVVKSMTIAEEMLEIFGERIEKFYNKQY